MCATRDDLQRHPSSCREVRCDADDAETLGVESVSVLEIEEHCGAVGCRYGDEKVTQDPNAARVHGTVCGDDEQVVVQLRSLDAADEIERHLKRRYALPRAAGLQVL